MVNVKGCHPFVGRAVYVKFPRPLSLGGSVGSLRTSLEGGGGSENPKKLLPTLCLTIRYGATPKQLHTNRHSTTYHTSRLICSGEYPYDFKTLQMTAIYTLGPVCLLLCYVLCIRLERTPHITFASKSIAFVSVCFMGPTNKHKEINLTLAIWTLCGHVCIVVVISYLP